METKQPNAIARVLNWRTSRREALRQVGGGATLAALGGVGGVGGVGLGVAHASTPTAEQATSPSAFAYKLEASQPTTYPGAQIRIATQIEFPVLNGVSIRSEQFDPGALQSPHWHNNAGELHYVISGQGSAGVVSPGGEHAVFELTPGSVSFFPRGHHHYVHSTGPEALRTLAVFTHELPTQFNIGEVMGIVPKPTLARVLGVAESDLPDLPAPTDRPVVALPGTVQAPVTTSSTTPPAPYTLNLDQLDPVVYEGGTVTNVRGKEFARLDGMSILPLSINVGGVREPHWHPNAAELLYIKSGTAEVGLVGPNGDQETFTLEAGDIGFFPMNWFHYIANVGDEPLDTLVYLSDAAPMRVDLSDAIGYLPLAVTATGVGLDPTTLDGLPQRTGVVVAGPSPEG